MWFEIITIGLLVLIAIMLFLMLGFVSLFFTTIKELLINSTNHTGSMVLAFKTFFEQLQKQRQLQKIQQMQDI